MGVSAKAPRPAGWERRAGTCQQITVQCYPNTIERPGRRSAALPAAWRA